MSVKSTIAWPFRQIGAFLRNAYAYATDFALDDVLPPSVRETINWLFGLVPRSLGLRDTSPEAQINANAVFIVFWFLAGFVSVGATWVLILVVHGPLLAVGVWRWFPGFNAAWQSFRRRLPVREDYDIPGWRSE